MSTHSPATFDAYHKWLGIPREEQPATYYRLLGLEPLEADAETIANAADARMAHIRRRQNGRHASVSQRLLNEISAARTCLLDAGKKGVYDEALRTVLAHRQSPTKPTAPPRWLNAPPLPDTSAPDPATPSPTTPPIAATSPIIVTQSTAGDYESRRRGRKSIGGAGWLVLALVTVAAMIVGMTVGAVAYWLTFRSQEVPLAIALRTALLERVVSEPGQPIEPPVLRR